MRRIVADSGPVFHLYEARLEPLLPEIGEINLPPAVSAELSALSPLLASRSTPAGESSASELAGLLARATVVLPPSAHQEAQSWQAAGLLHRGEAEALALARQRRADWFLTDDAAARLLATQLGQEVHGSLGVVLWAAATRRFDEPAARRALGALARTSLWVSRRVLAEAEAALEELFG